MNSAGREWADYIAQVNKVETAKATAGGNGECKIENGKCKMMEVAAGDTAILHSTFYILH